MNARYAKLFRRLVVVIASLPLLQTAGCGAEFLASAIANETASEFAGVLSISLETALRNLFGV